MPSRGHLTSSYFLRNADIETAPRTELRRKHADARPVPDLVNFIKQIYDIKAQCRGLALIILQEEVARYARIDLGVRRYVIDICKPRPQAAAENHRGAEPGA